MKGRPGPGGLPWVPRDGAYVVPGLPAVGHITRSGYWHPGRPERCVKCHPRERETRNA